jgi:hypothetical protein
MSKPEDAARDQIDAALGQAGGIIRDAGNANVYAGRGVALREFPLKHAHGFADYLLHVDAQAAGVIAAQKAGSVLSLFWLKDDSLEDAVGLDDPDLIAAEIVDDLRAAREEFELIRQDLAGE